MQVRDLRPQFPESNCIRKGRIDAMRFCVRPASGVGSCGREAGGGAIWPSRIQADVRALFRPRTMSRSGRVAPQRGQGVRITTTRPKAAVTWRMRTARIHDENTCCPLRKGACGLLCADTVLIAPR